MGQQVQRRLRAGLAFLRHLAQARRTHREQRNLCPREETIHRDEQNHQQDLKWGVAHCQIILQV